MLNLNLNTLNANLNRPGPITTQQIFYALIGGGGGGSQAGGNGGQGGQIVTSSFIITHTDSCFITEIGQGGLGGLTVSGNIVRLGLNGTGSTTLEYKSSQVNAASGGLGNFNTNTTQADPPGTILPIQLNPTFDDCPGQSCTYTAGDGTKGSIATQGIQGVGFGGGGFGAPAAPPAVPAVDVGGVGTNGAAILSFFDPRNIFTYEGDYNAEFYTNGYRIFYYTTTGFFKFIGTSQR